MNRLRQMERIQGVDSRDKLKHTERSDMLLSTWMMQADEQ